MSATVPTLLLQALREAPQHVAVQLLEADSSQAVTYDQLLYGSSRYAHALAARGIRAGQPVVIILQHGLDLIEAFFGAMLLGAIPSILPFLSDKLTPERYRKSLEALIGVTRPTAIITYREFAPEVHRALKQGDSVRCVLLTDQLEGTVEPPMEELPGWSSPPESIALLQHSSGTTGLQKGVALSHRAVLNQLEHYGRAIQMTRDDRVVSWLPLYHDMGLIAGFLMPILLRATLVLMSPFDWVRAPQRLLRAVSDYRGTLSWLPNFAYNFMAKKIPDRSLDGVDLSSWRLVSNCSEPMRWNSHRAFLERFHAYGLRPSALATCYAMAENVFAVTQGGIDESVTVDDVDRASLFEQRLARPSADGSKNGSTAVKMLSAGRPIDGTRLRILDEEHQDLPERAVGEIAIQGDCILSGYYNRPELTREAYHDGWYLTGDLGYLADGELYVCGRRKELIIVGGKNIYPQDLEQIAAEVPGVHPGRVVAFGVWNDELGTEDVVIVAETDTDSSEERRRIAQEIRDHVTKESDVAVRRVEVVGPRSIEKTSSGKPARLAHRAKYLAEAQTQLSLASSEKLDLAS